MSDVFDDYCRIMMDKGYIKKEAQQTRVEKESDSDYREKIQALYGLDIKLNDSNKSIVEQAHPDMVVIAPSYDKMNGVVENIQERQNVMIDIALKPTSGNLTQHRYARKELLDELISLGFKLDNDGEEELAKEATALAIQVADSKKKVTIKKEAAAPAILAILASKWLWGAIAGIGVWGAVKSKMVGYMKQGVISDTERAIESLNALKEVVAGSDKAIAEQFISAFTAFLSESNKALNILSRSRVETPEVKSSEDILKAKQHIVGTKEEIEFAKKYLKMAAFVANSIGSSSPMNENPKSIIPTLERMTIVTQETEGEWWQMTKWVWDNTFGGVTGAGDPKIHAINSVAAVRDSINALIQNYKTESVEGATQAKSKAVSARDAFAKAVGFNDSEETPKGPPTVGKPAVTKTEEPLKGPPTITHDIGSYVR